MHFYTHFRFNSTSFVIIWYLCFCHTFQCFYLAISLYNALHVCTYSLLNVRYALQCFYLATGSWTFDSIAAATRASTYTDILYILIFTFFLLYLDVFLLHCTSLVKLIYNFLYAYFNCISILSRHFYSLHFSVFMIFQNLNPNSFFFF